MFFALLFAAQWVTLGSMFTRPYFEIIIDRIVFILLAVIAAILFGLVLWFAIHRNDGV